MDVRKLSELAQYPLVAVDEFLARGALDNAAQAVEAAKHQDEIQETLGHYPGISPQVDPSVQR